MPVLTENNVFFTIVRYSDPLSIAMERHGVIACNGAARVVFVELRAAPDFHQSRIAIASLVFNLSAAISEYGCTKRIGINISTEQISYNREATNLDEALIASTAPATISLTISAAGLMSLMTAATAPIKWGECSSGLGSVPAGRVPAARSFFISASRLFSQSMT